MQTVVAGNMLKACRGGEPGMYSLVRSFVKAGNVAEYLGMEQVFIDDLPFWPIFYYCLRCGDMDAALHCVKQLRYRFFFTRVAVVSILQRVFFLSSDSGSLMKIVGELKNSPCNRLTPQTEKNFLLDYKRMVRNSPDPFKR